MDTYFGGKPQNRRFIDLVREREIKESTARLLAQKTNVTEDLVSRLGLEKELEGHTGCVNCLEWSESGDTLASASDDMHIFLWNAFSYKILCSFGTGHTGNIFSVKFMPKSNGNIVASGAADARVKVFNLSLGEVLFSCSCHTNRVKRIATVDDAPYLLWSAGEDGLVLQHDLRTPHVCSDDPKTILIDLERQVGHRREIKCIAVNARRPELVAIGANDAFVRMYDRRCSKHGWLPVETFPVSEDNGAYVESSGSRKIDNDRTILVDCSQYFVAGHLRPRKPSSARSYAATYLAFSGDGNELLVNMGGEHIYLFDIIQRRSNRLFDVPNDDSFQGIVPVPDCTDFSMWSAAYGNDYNAPRDYTLRNTRILPDHVEKIKQEANDKFKMKKYSAATELYNTALGYCPTAAVLYGNRAAALMKRKWDGDTYAALRDCQTCLLLDPSHVKAHFRLAQCLYDLGCLNEAHMVIRDFQKTFPEYADNSARRALKQDISIGLEQVKKLERDVRTLHPELCPERVWRSSSVDYKLRYCGHCNVTTDIKEANFFGRDEQYIIAGSDDGNIFIWDRHTTNIVRILRGDAKIVNCLQPHPSTCLIATSGIDSVIRLWSPLPEDDKPNDRRLTNHEDIANANQVRLYDPLTLMVMDMMGYNAERPGATVEEDDDEDDGAWAAPQPPGCRQS